MMARRLVGRWDIRSSADPCVTRGTFPQPLPLVARPVPDGPAAWRLARHAKVASAARTAGGAQGRDRSGGELFTRLINGDRGGYHGYATWRKYLRFAHGYTAAHPDGAVSYTAHELRHVCASLLIASGASDMQVARQMGHSKIETTKNIYGHLFAQDRTAILDALNQAVSRLHAYESDELTARKAGEDVA